MEGLTDDTWGPWRCPDSCSSIPGRRLDRIAAVVQAGDGRVRMGSDKAWAEDATVSSSWTGRGWGTALAATLISGIRDLPAEDALRLLEMPFLESVECGCNVCDENNVPVYLQKVLSLPTVSSIRGFPWITDGGVVGAGHPGPGARLVVPSRCPWPGTPPWRSSKSAPAPPTGHAGEDCEGPGEFRDAFQTSYVGFPLGGGNDGSPPKGVRPLFYAFHMVYSLRL